MYVLNTLLFLHKEETGAKRQKNISDATFNAIGQAVADMGWNLIPQLNGEASGSSEGGLPPSMALADVEDPHLGGIQCRVHTPSVGWGGGVVLWGWWWGGVG